MTARRQGVLRVDRSDGVVRWTLDRPEKLNSISPEMVSAMDEAIRELTVDVRCLVITGAGRAFCAGGDLTAVRALASSDDVPADVLARFHRSITDVLRRIERLPFPVICAVNGIAVAGGIEVAAACDIVIAEPETPFGDGHSRYGLLPGGGGSVRLPRLIGPNRAKLLMLTGRQVSGRTMADWGLVSILAAPGDLDREVDRVVAEVLDRSPDGLDRMKALVDGNLELAVDEALDREQRIVAQYSVTSDYAEGLRAFDEKRPPRFALSRTR